MVTSNSISEIYQDSAHVKIIITDFLLFINVAITFEFPKKSYKRQQSIDIADGLLQSVITRSLCLELLTLNSCWASKGLQHTIFTWLNVYTMAFITVQYL